MSRLTPSQLLIANLEGKLPPSRRGYLTKEQAIDRLREATGKDFGDDVAAWKRYLKEHGLRP